MIRFDNALDRVEIPGSFAVLTLRNDGMCQESVMVRRNEIREGEVAVTPPPPTDAGLTFIGRIHTPWTDRMMTPRPKNRKAIKLKKAAHSTAYCGFSTRVETIVAMEFAASCRPLRKSNSSATAIRPIRS